MRKLNNKIVAFVVATLTLVSCSDDFTEVNPPYGINSESYFAAEDDYYNALIGAYDVLQSTYVNVILG